MQTPADKEHFLRLIEENKAIIYKICNSYCPNKADREDLAQEIIYQLWRSGHSLDPDRRFSTWMYRVALNVAISFYRKTFQGNTVVSLSGEEENIADNTNTGEQEENLKRLQTFIYALKELERALMILYLESKTYKEIAEILGITETNVATRISRIKEKLKQKFLTTNN
ncbi:MAG: sigma-70 family RNA polymerase sigma factor [Bacteroidota bacterium]